MCGDYGQFEGDYDGDSTMLGGPVSLRARKEYECAACQGLIPAGAYHTRLSWQEDRSVYSMRMHLQCRDICHEMGWYEMGIVVGEAENDEEKGEEWLAHRRSLYEWAAGGRYTYGLTWTQEEIDAANARAKRSTDLFGDEKESGE